MTLTPEKIARLRATTQREFDNNPNPSSSIILGLLDDIECMARDQEHAQRRFDAALKVLRSPHADARGNAVVYADAVREALTK